MDSNNKQLLKGKLEFSMINPWDLALLKFWETHNSVTKKRLNPWRIFQPPYEWLSLAIHGYPQEADVDVIFWLPLEPSLWKIRGGMDI